MLTALATASGFSYAKVPMNKIENEIMQQFETLKTTVKTLDIDAYFNLIDANKFVGLNADGSNWNSIDEFKTLMEPSFNSIAKVHKLEFTNVNISVIDSNTAILVNEFEQDIELKNGQTHSFAGGGTQVWSKQTGKWLLVSISASSKP